VEGEVLDPRRHRAVRGARGEARVEWPPPALTRGECPNQPSLSHPPGGSTSWTRRDPVDAAEELVRDELPRPAVLLGPALERVPDGDAAGHVSLLAVVAQGELGGVL